jgi:hypothetical protein
MDIFTRLHKPNMDKSTFLKDKKILTHKIKGIERFILSRILQFDFRLTNSKVSIVLLRISRIQLCKINEVNRSQCFPVTS